MAGINILFAPVAQASVDLEIIALDAKENIDIELGKNSAAVNGLSGFDSAAALKSCAESWNAHLVQLVRDTLDASLRLASTVKDYQDLERRLAGALDAMDTGR